VRGLLINRSSDFETNQQFSIEDESYSADFSGHWARIPLSVSSARLENNLPLYLRLNNCSANYLVPRFAHILLISWNIELKAPKWSGIGREIFWIRCPCLMFLWLTVIIAYINLRSGTAEQRAMMTYQAHERFLQLEVTDEMMPSIHPWHVAGSSSIYRGLWSHVWSWLLPLGSFTTTNQGKEDIASYTPNHRPGAFKTCSTTSPENEKEAFWTSRGKKVFSNPVLWLLAKRTAANQSYIPNLCQTIIMCNLNGK